MGEERIEEAHGTGGCYGGLLVAGKTADGLLVAAGLLEANGCACLDVGLFL